MLLDGVNHVAILTQDTDVLHAFYRDVFDAEIGDDVAAGPGMRLSFVHIGPHSELNVFQVDGNDETAKSAAMFGRGPIDHIGLQAASIEAFDTIRDRLIERGATDGFVTDFAPVLSCFYVGPDGLESGEVWKEATSIPPAPTIAYCGRGARSLCSFTMGPCPERWPLRTS
jgi:catechol 2,3-dioxygenase-like lactoylglutathione lyase family enzyme